MPNRCFALDGDEAVSLRDVIIREIVANCLIHREFISPFPARILIDAETLRTENANRAMFQGPITPTGFNSLSKNPIIASFFSTIGLAEELGSGTRSLFRCSPRYSGKDPEPVEAWCSPHRFPSTGLPSSPKRAIRPHSPYRDYRDPRAISPGWSPSAGV